MSTDSPNTVLTKLIEYTTTELASGAGIAELTATTPLLAHGILDSLRTARMITYIREEFGVRVPPAQIIGDNFKDLASVSRMVGALRD